MRLNLRIILNVVLVMAVGGTAMVWAVAGLANVSLFGDDRETVRAMVPRAAGALPGAEVTYLGQPIGQVRDSELTDDGVLVTMDVDLPAQTARTLRADVRQKSALGEPYVDLGPAGPDDDVQALAAAGNHDGTTIPLARTSVPAGIGQLLNDTGALLADVDPASLGTLIDGASSAVVSKEAEIGRILENAAVVAKTVRAREAEIDALLANTAQLSETLDAASGDVGASLDSFAQLGTVLARRTSELESVLRQGAELSREGSQLIDDVRDDVDGVLGGLDTTFETLADRPGKVAETLRLTPLMVERFGFTFEGSNFWLSAGGGIPFASAFNPRLGIPVYGTGLRIDRIFTPTIAQKITVDLAELGVPTFGTIQLLPNDRIGAAAQEPGGLQELIDDVGDSLRNDPPQGG